jgi:hypothetical protein
MDVIERVPNVVFKTRVRDESVEGANPYRWQDTTSEDIFKGKKVVVFSLPGAFTPTCSSNHLPRYARGIAGVTMPQTRPSAPSACHCWLTWVGGRAGLIYTSTQKASTTG